MFEKENPNLLHEEAIGQIMRHAKESMPEGFASGMDDNEFTNMQRTVAKNLLVVTLANNEGKNSDEAKAELMKIGLDENTAEKLSPKPPTVH